MLPTKLREGLQRKSFVVALRSKSYNKDWEWKARPEGTRPKKIRQS